ncbi:MAG: hypothetical protein ABI624_10440 [Casimicrobiaceae bacterium]
MDRARASAISQIETALRTTLDDIRRRAADGAGRSTVSELMRHARDLAGLLDQAIGRLGDHLEAQDVRAAAGDLNERLRALELRYVKQPLR